jgi:hypothetical protein
MTSPVVKDKFEHALNQKKHETDYYLGGWFVALRVVWA